MNLASIVLILVSATFLNPMAAQQKESDVPDYMKIKRIVIKNLSLVYFNIFSRDEDFKFIIII